ncbi:MAG: serine acetyltransferase [Aromatoleum sp.]|nr:serine acetyltransferase [Aromatoleum sp.]
MSLGQHDVPILPALLHRTSVALSQVSIGDQVVIDAGVYVLHGQIVIDGFVRIGRGVALSPWVTIGPDGGSTPGPTLGDGVFVGTGARILGPVHVGANAKIAANSVVVDDVPPDTTVAGSPARVVADRRPQL